MVGAFFLSSDTIQDRWKVDGLFFLFFACCLSSFLMQLLLESEDVVRGKDCLTIPTDLQVVLHVSFVYFFLVYIYKL